MKEKMEKLQEISKRLEELDRMANQLGRDIRDYEFDYHHNNSETTKVHTGWMFASILMCKQDIENLLKEERTNGEERYSD